MGVDAVPELPFERGVAGEDGRVVAQRLPEEDLPAINRERAKVGLPVTALSSDRKVELGQGELTLVDNQIDATSGTIRVRSVFDNPNGVLTPGM